MFRGCLACVVAMSIASTNVAAEDKVRALCAAAMDKDEAKRNAALAELEKAAPKLYDDVTSLALGKTTAAVKPALARLALAKTSAAAAIPAVAACATKLLPEDPASGNHFIGTLGSIGPADKEALVAIGVVMAIPDTKGKRRTWTTFGAMKLADVASKTPDSRTLIPDILSPFANDKDAIVRRRVAEGLGHCGGNAKNAIPVLKKLKLDEDEAVRIAANAALKKVDGN